MGDWITVTLGVNGYRKRIRRSAALAYGKIPPSGGPTYVVLGSMTLEVRETEAEIAALLEDDVLSKSEQTSKRDPMPVTPLDSIPEDFFKKTPPRK